MIRMRVETDAERIAEIADSFIELITESRNRNFNLLAQGPPFHTICEESQQCFWLLFHVRRLIVAQFAMISPDFPAIGLCLLGCSGCEYVKQFLTDTY